MRVRVLNSPYFAVKKGALGSVIGERHVGSRYHVYRVEFIDGSSWLFYPNELRFLEER